MRSNDNPKDYPIRQRAKGLGLTATPGPAADQVGTARLIGVKAYPELFEHVDAICQAVHMTRSELLRVVLWNLTPEKVPTSLDQMEDARAALAAAHAKRIEALAGPGDIVVKEPGRMGRRRSQCEIVDALCERLRSNGERPVREVMIEGGGIADVVTDNAVYEVKSVGDVPHLHAAVGQVTLYAALLARPRRVIVAPLRKKTSWFCEQLSNTGIEFIAAEDVVSSKSAPVGLTTG